MSKITPQTKWGDVLKSLTNQEEKEKVLDAVYELTYLKLPNDYEIGNYLEAARQHFWHKERINEETGQAKTVGVKKSDALFAQYSVEHLAKIGFFEDVKNDLDFDKVDSRGFIVGECANIESKYGYNIYTGTQYCAEQDGIEEQDVDGYKKSGVNAHTQTLYDRHFFRYDEELGQWVNLITGEDKDLLGYNHEGIRIDERQGRTGFDRDGLWHEKLEDGTYSKIGSKYDKDGYDVHGFNRYGRTKFNTVIVNDFLADGRNTYNDTLYVDGYDIDGFDEQGFNRAGIHNVTGCYYSPQGYTKDKKPFPIFDALKSNDPLKKEKTILEWTILSNVYPEFKRGAWYEVGKRKLKIKDLDEELQEISPALQDIQKLEFQTGMAMLADLDQEIDENTKLTKELLEKREMLKAKNKEIIAELNSSMKSHLREIEGKRSESPDER